MREWRIEKNDAGQRLDKFLSKALYNMPPSLLYKSIRTKKIKINRQRATPSRILEEGDTLQLFLRDEFFEKSVSANVSTLKSIHPHLSIIYEDQHIILLNKRPGVSVHDDEHQATDNLLTHLKAYLYQKKEYEPLNEHSFAPALCNRIDRNTGGIVIAAKNAEALRVMNEKIRAREIDKYYLCAVHGVPQPPTATLTAYLQKLSDENRVVIRDCPSNSPNEKEIRTKYTLLAQKEDRSLLEIQLLTGRTHQIRAHMAHIGHPLIGDGKYGINHADRLVGYKYQALYSYRLVFNFQDDHHVLSYLNHKEFKVPLKDIYFMNIFDN